MFGKRESEVKGEKMREKKKSGKNESFCTKSLLHQSCPVHVLIKACILLRTREIKKMYEVPQIHRGKFRKKSQKAGQSGVKLDTRAGCENSQPVKFRSSQSCKIFAVFQTLPFLLHFPSNF